MHNSAEFRRLQRGGSRHESRHFVIYAGKIVDDSARPRLGVTVSGRIGNAVVRNRIKRRVRECFRLELRDLMPPDASLVVIARKGAGDLRYSEIQTELTASVRIAGARLKAAAS